MKYKYFVAILLFVLAGTIIFLWFWNQKETREFSAKNDQEQQDSSKNDTEQKTDEDIKKDSEDADTGKQNEQGVVYYPPEGKNEMASFSNSLMKVSFPSSWKYSETKEGALNLVKNNYILYIHPNVSQASGVEGGRFAEIAQGAPGAELVVTEWPSEPCGNKGSKTLTSVLERTDYYVNKMTKSSSCNAPSNDKSVWYFSYITSQGDGYFGDASKLNSKLSPSRQFVITMTAKANSINNLPSEDDSVLASMLAEMSDIVKTLELK